MTFAHSLSRCVSGFMKPITVKLERTPSKLSAWERIKRTYNFLVTEQIPTPAAKVGKKTLVLDLDETLIHSSSFLPHPLVESFKIEFDEDEDDEKQEAQALTKRPNREVIPHAPNQRTDTMIIYLRPGVRQFLDYVTDHFDVFIFTHGTKSYADKIMDHLCPQIDVNHRYYRDSCEMVNHGKTVHKDLDIFCRDPKDLILVDDNSAAQIFHPNNTIQIQKWKGTPNDHVLIDWLMPILKECETTDDVREIILKNKNAKRQSAPI